MRGTEEINSKEKKMSGLNDWKYLEIGARKTEGGIYPTSTPQEGSTTRMKRVWKSLKGFMLGCMRALAEQPASYNERIPKSPYDHIHMRGLW